MAFEIIVFPPLTVVTIQVFLDEDWFDAIWPIEHGPSALDLTGKILELTIRPARDHTTVLAVLTSVSEGGILFTNAAAGRASLYLPRADVVAQLPLGRWEHFLRLLEPAPTAGTYLIREIWRGPLIVHPGRI